jgi:hypothetical protein
MSVTQRGRGALALLGARFIAEGNLAVSSCISATPIASRKAREF